MKTPAVSKQRKYVILTTALVGFVLLTLLISCAALHAVHPAQSEQPAKYIVTFGQDPPDPNHRVRVNMATFERALGWDNSFARAPNWTTLKKRMSDQGAEEDVRTKTPKGDPNAVTIAHVTVTEDITVDKASNTMHVTQRVGLDNRAQMKAVLAAIDAPQ